MSMKDHTGCKRGFTQLSKAWYGPATLEHSPNIDEISAGFYCAEGGTTREFHIAWGPNPNGKIVPYLVAYGDGWDALFHFSDMLKLMADVDGEDISPDEFCKLLEYLGIENRTPFERWDNVNLTGRTHWPGSNAESKRSG